MEKINNLDGKNEFTREKEKIMNKYKFSDILYFSTVIIFIVNILFLIYYIINLLNIGILGKILFISYVFISIISFFIWEYFAQRSEEIFARIELDYLPGALEKINKQFPGKILNEDEYIRKKMEILASDNKWIINDNLKKIIKTGKITYKITLTLFFLVFIFGKSNFNNLNIITYIIICSIISQVICLIFSIIIMNILKKKPIFA